VPELREVIERVEAEPDVDGDWSAVVRGAGAPRRRALIPLGGLTVALLIAALTLFQPWGRESPSFLERALAAVDDGPVVHAVLRGDWGGTNVDLETGARTPVHGENEIWYDTERRLIRWVIRLGDSINEDRVYDPERVSPELVALGRDYRAALESGSARIAGEETIDGRRATWIVVESAMLPDSSGGKLHEWTQQVAVSNETFKPVATRDTRDGRPGPGTFQRVLQLETLPAGEGDFTPGSAAGSDEGIYYLSGSDTAGLDEVAGVLGRPPLWLGGAHAGLPFTRVSETFIRERRQRRTEWTGEAAEDARGCLRVLRPADRRTSSACERIRERRGGVETRLGRVLEPGPIEWGEKQRGVSLVYGTLEQRGGIVVVSTDPFIRIDEAVQRSAFLGGGGYFPPPGFVFLAAGNRRGALQVDGLYVVIHAQRPELILSAARALQPLPQR
jgi:hypothetical protein